MRILAAIVFGTLVGLALGATGSGGATLAVPLLVLGLSVDAAHAVAISLLSVGSAAVIGFVNRLRRHEVDLAVGAVLAAGGIVTAPIGASLGRRMPEALLLGLFGVLVLIVSARMWLLARQEGHPATGPCAVTKRVSWQCLTALSGAGVATGLLSGMFGIGGGLVVVPVMIFATGASVHRAAATSLMVISIVSIVALASILIAGHEISWAIAVPFLAGTLIGMAAGTILGRRFSGPRLQRGFAIALGLVAALVFARALVP